jgi:hypothetical protein
MIKRMYQIISLIAVIQLLALSGLIGYMFASKRLTGERVDQIAKLLRGESAQQAAPTTQPVAEAVKPESATSQIARSQQQQELFSMIAERQSRELQDRAKLNQTIQLDVLRKLEEIDRREKTFAEQQKKLRAQQSQDGFSRELEVITAIDATRARKLLMMQKEPDAVRLLMDMEPARAKKIIDTCKTPEEMEWARRILDQLHNLNNERAASARSGPSGAEASGSSPTPSMGG